MNFGMRGFVNIELDLKPALLDPRDCCVRRVRGAQRA
jgi:hypothetical protein